MSIHILAISGSLRAGSTNTGLLRYASTRLPDNVTMEIYIPSDLPLFSQDLETSVPDSVKEFRAKVLKADAILFSIPEYNFGLPGGFKNAIDWASRGEHGNCFNDKAAGIISAGAGAGGLRAQQHMRDVALFLNLHIMNSPTILVKLFDSPMPCDMTTGDLLDEKIKGYIDDYIHALIAWTKRLHPSKN